MIQSRVIAASRISERRWDLHMKNGTDILLPEGHEVDALDRLLVLQQETALLDRPLQGGLHRDHLEVVVPPVDRVG